MSLNSSSHGLHRPFRSRSPSSRSHASSRSHRHRSRSRSWSPPHTSGLGIEDASALCKSHGIPFSACRHKSCSSLTTVLDLLLLIEKQEVVIEDLDAKSLSAPNVFRWLEQNKSELDARTLRSTVDTLKGEVVLIDYNFAFLACDSHMLHCAFNFQDARWTCKICFERPLRIVFAPCHHQVCCEKCAVRVDRCPVCKDLIWSRIAPIVS